MEPTRFLFHGFRFHRRLLTLLWGVLIFVWCAMPALAAEHPEQDDREGAATETAFRPRMGEYHYEIQWARSRVATGIITIQREGDLYRLTADQRTTKFIDRIYRVRYRGETWIHAGDLSPSESVIVQEVKKRKKVQKARYDSETGSVSVEETRSKEKRAKMKKKTYELQSDTGIVDVFTAIFLARSFDWSVGERHSFQVFIGEKQYVVTLDCVGMSTFELQEDTIPVWVIRPGIRKTTAAAPSPVSQKTRIFIAADESKDVVKIETEPGIGTVTLRLVSIGNHDTP